jgi:tetratricopeptide (TPR) repeat protein
MAVSHLVVIVSSRNKIFMKVLSFFIFIFFFGYIKSQQRQIDSLITLASKASHDSTKLKLYEEICRICETEDNLKYGRILDSLASRLISAATSEKEREKFIRKKIKAYFIIGIYYDELEIIDSLEKYRLKSIEVSRTTNNSGLINEQLENLAEMYRRENQYTKAMNIYTDELKGAEKTGNKQRIIFALAGMSTTYSRMHNNKKALEYELKKLKIVQESVTDPAEVGYAYVNVGRQYYNLHDYETAILFYLKAYAILEKKINDRDKSYYLFLLARAYNENKNSTDARNYFLKALDMVTQMGDSVVIGVVHSEIGQTYFYEKKIDKALEYKLKGIGFISGKLGGDAILPYLTTGQIYLETGQHKLAEKYVLVAKEIAEGRQDIHSQKAVMGVLADIYKNKGDHARANEYLVKFYQLKDSLDRMRNVEELLYKELNYENEKNEARLLSEQEKKDLEAQNQKRKQSLITLFAVIVLVFVLVFLFFVFRSLRRTKQQKKIIELKELETQKQKRLVEEKNKEITDSIRYAKRIQTSLITSEKYIEKTLRRMWGKK